MTRRPRSAVAARFLRRFGANLAAARLRAGLTQYELADLAGVTQSYISAVEHGAQNPTVQSMVDLSAAVREEMVEMMTGTCPAQRAGPRLRADDRRLGTAPSEAPRARRPRRDG
jgi:transcriptional regulator with XRE-family HTH domain